MNLNSNDNNEEILDVGSLNQKYEQKMEMKREILSKVLKRCCSKIKFQSSIGKQWCIFHIPPYLIGYPLYKQDEALMYLQTKLRDMGLNFKQVQPYVLLIGWMHIPSEYTSQEENVIVSPWS